MRPVYIAHAYTIHPVEDNSEEITDLDYSAPCASRRRVTPRLPIWHLAVSLAGSDWHNDLLDCWRAKQMDEDSEDDDSEDENKGSYASVGKLTKERNVSVISTTSPPTGVQKVLRTTSPPSKLESNLDVVQRLYDAEDTFYQGKQKRLGRTHETEHGTKKRSCLNRWLTWTERLHKPKQKRGTRWATFRGEGEWGINTGDFNSKVQEVEIEIGASVTRKSQVL